MKLALPMPCSSSTECSVSSPVTDRACGSESLYEMKGLRLIDLEQQPASVTRLASCNVCDLALLSGKTWVFAGGVCTKLTLSCTNPLCTGKEDAVSDPNVHSKTLNTRFILAGKMCGRGSAGLETICGLMGLPPPVSPRSYSMHNNALQKFVQNVRMESSMVASEQLHRLQGDDPNDVIDVTVTCDGSWSHRGFVVLYGVVAVISCVGDRPDTRCDGPEQILQSLQGNRKCHGKRVAGVPGLECEAPGLLQFEFHRFFSSYGSRRSLDSLGGGQWRRTGCGTPRSYPMGISNLSCG